MIDKNDLDEELIRQPDKFFKSGELAARASARRDFLKEELARTDAELASKHREKLMKVNGKATESQVEGAVVLDPKHKAASDAYIKAKETADLAQAAKDAFHQRRYMLQDLSTLYTANYFESASANNAGVREAKANRALDAMAEQRKRKRD